MHPDKLYTLFFLFLFLLLLLLVYFVTRFQVLIIYLCVCVGLVKLNKRFLRSLEFRPLNSCS
jgi:hypothetical protein